MSYSLNSLTGDEKGDYNRAYYRGILGVYTIAHVRRCHAGGVA